MHANATREKWGCVKEWILEWSLPASKTRKGCPAFHSISCSGAAPAAAAKGETNGGEVLGCSGGVLGWSQEARCCCCCCHCHCCR